MSHFFPAPEAIVNDLGPAAAVLYGRIWRYCQGGGVCFATLATLASECNVNERTVRRWVARLAADGYITHESGKASGKTNCITTTTKWVMGGVGQDVQGVGQNVQGGRTNSPTGVGQNVQRLKDVEEKTEDKNQETTSTSKTPLPPTLQAGKPGDQDATRTVPTRAQASVSPSRSQRSSKSDQAASPAGDDHAPKGRWHGVATAIAQAIGRPEPRGMLPTWLGNTVAAFGAAAGDDPERAADLVEAWARSKALRDALDPRFFRDRDLASNAGAWIATSGRTMAAGRQAAPVDREGARMLRLGAPDNWRDIVYAPGGVRRSPVLALPRMGLEPYAQQGEWPAWYRAFEGAQP